MSFFSWFSGTSSKDQHVSGKARPDSDSSGLTRDERTRPVAGARARASAPTPLKTGEHAGEQKSQRHAKRELLYAAVREAMIRAGVLSASYKFKVLSLDPRGDQFMVMMDLAQEFGGQADRLAEIEVMIAQSAKSRYNIRVTAVYWRMNELVSVGRPRPSSHGAQPHNAPAVAATAGAAAALPEPAVAVVAAVAAAEPDVAAPVASRFEPIQDDEVAAFKQALAAASASGGTAQVVQKGVSTRSGPHSYTLLTGFEDTEMPEMPVSAPALSATQYGDLV
ncbi:MAG: hypothetical protein Q8M93_11500 [Polaromonas sp.]|uniref:hypothetical protein n=1 Tax=Polaromonas sp. TaxID=1869339 RepID=UPI002730ABB9|nr:hypothetical protein [Polaromonas sp.]MDP2448745.1 hypothetical protein [Polaromonas sp.]MDP3247581.1 hypothetical protein [Polaromonas sp.]MDP3756151.1 hypothetical protein [Polaromonas sp.]MDP3829243.1 hypothetical protein [Polaromonas sp.]